MDPKAKPSGPSMASYLRGLQRGLGADVLGGPVDLTTEVLNAGILGVNMLGGNLPKIEKPFGGSDWFADRMMSSDDGSASYTAGRLTPLGASAAGAGLSGAKRLVNALLSRPAPSRGAVVPTPKSQLGAIVWHGSPHTFDKFDSAQIGSGEGAQAYGHGLYFAENRNVARHYWDKLSTGFHGSFEKGGRSVTGPDALSEYFRPGRLLSGYGGTDKVLEFRPPSKEGGSWAVKVVRTRKDGSEMPFERPRLHSTMPSDKEMAAVLEPEGWKSVRPGGVYEVDLPDPAISQMLNWDKQLKDQPDSVKRAFDEALRRGLDRDTTSILKGEGHNLNAGTFYTLLGQDDNLRSKETASQLLKEVGVPGIRYLDGDSRQRGQGTSNFVVFPGKEDMLKILRRTSE